MNIIQKQANPSGAYPPIQSWNGETPPATHYEVAEGVELSCGGFGTLTIVDNIVMAFTPNETAWNAWNAANPQPTPQPTTEEKIVTLQSKLAASIQSNQMLEECVVEMAGVVYA